MRGSRPGVDIEDIPTIHTTAEENKHDPTRLHRLEPDPELRFLGRINNFTGRSPSSSALDIQPDGRSILYAPNNPMDPAHNATDPAMTRSTYFTFTAPSPPPLDFTFLPEPVPTYTGKRARPVGLSDTDDHPITKKRRLRLDLITSRLSSPFAVPATNIGVRIPRPSGGRRRVGSGVLRKAAILNKIRRDAAVKRMEQEKKVEAARREFRLVTGGNG